MMINSKTVIWLYQLYKYNLIIFNVKRDDTYSYVNTLLILI